MIERFVDLLDIAIENYKEETIENLKEWGVQESDFHVIAMETKFGLDHGTTPESKKQSFFYIKNHNERLCKICNGKHGSWACDTLRSLSHSESWDKAKGLELCFRCLGDNQFGENCKRTRKCGINGCKKVHHRLLHKYESYLNPVAASFEPKEQTYTNTDKNVYIALRTVPVLVSANGHQLKINAILDDGSTKTYIDEDIAEELGMRNEYENVTVTTLNGKSENFQTISVNFNVMSLDGNTHVNIEANTTHRVTGNLKPIDWNHYSKNWPHLKGYNFLQ